jgi:hypothetical protein
MPADLSVRLIRAFDTNTLKYANGGRILARTLRNHDIHLRLGERPIDECSDCLGVSAPAAAAGKGGSSRRAALKAVSGNVV